MGTCYTPVNTVHWGMGYFMELGELPDKFLWYILSTDGNYIPHPAVNSMRQSDAYMGQ